MDGLTYPGQSLTRPLLPLLTPADDEGQPVEEKKKREYKEMEHKNDGDQHARVGLDTVRRLDTTRLRMDPCGT